MKIADKKYDGPAASATALGLLVCESQCRHPPCLHQSVSFK